MSAEQNRINDEITDHKPGGNHRGRRRITFLLGDERYCADIMKVKEIIRLTPITRVPKMPPYIVGVVNLRGDILSVIDIGRFLGLGERGVSEETRIIVSEWQGDLVGILVDEVTDTIDLGESPIQPPLPSWKGKGAECVEGEIEREGKIYILVDFDRVLGSQELRKLRY